MNDFTLLTQEQCFGKDKIKECDRKIRLINKIVQILSMMHMNQKLIDF